MGFTVYKRYWHGKTHISHFALHLFFIFNQNFHVEYTITISNRVSVYYYDTYIIAKPLCYHCISHKIGLSLFLGVFFFSFHFYLFRSFFLNSFPSFFFFLNWFAAIDIGSPANSHECIICMRQKHLNSNTNTRWFVVNRPSSAFVTGRKMWNASE